MLEDPLYEKVLGVLAKEVVCGILSEDDMASSQVLNISLHYINLICIDLQTIPVGIATSSLVMQSSLLAWAIYYLGPCT